ncbi:hypothetical protein [Undibacterium sp. Ji49W]|uniref:hypothetical protein n=1 Tax=Undibacterium sp. Ji49W TaxID=3413040 RepID=UPI003BEF6BD0
MAELKARIQRAENDTFLADFFDVEKDSFTWVVNNDIRKLSPTASPKNLIFISKAYDYVLVKHSFELAEKFIQFSKFEEVSVSFPLPNGDFPDWIHLDMKQFYDFIFKIYKLPRAFDLRLKNGNDIYVLMIPEDDLLIFQSRSN